MSRISRRLPYHFKDQAEFNGFVLEGVVGSFAPAAPFLDSGTPITTVGSCFAKNVAKHLNRLDYNILYLHITDRLFSPLALQYFFENLSADVTFFQKHWNIDQATLDTLRARLTNGTTVIVTFGMSVVWVNQTTGEYVFDPTKKNMARRLLLPSGEFQMAQTSVDENIEAMSLMVNAIKRLNRANKVILTLSPLPLLYARHNPVVVADCISKSTLRVALDEVMRAGLKDVHYFPSFELLKWLAPTVDTIWFEDDIISHIRNDWIEYTMGVFSELYCADKLPKILPVNTFIQPGSSAAPNEDLDE